jgi:hypothetical protein
MNGRADYGAVIVVNAQFVGDILSVNGVDLMVSAAEEFHHVVGYLRSLTFLGAVNDQDFRHGFSPLRENRPATVRVFQKYNVDSTLRDSWCLGVGACVRNAGMVPHVTLMEIITQARMRPNFWRWRSDRRIGPIPKL